MQFAARLIRLRAAVQRGFKSKDQKRLGAALWANDATEQLGRKISLAAEQTRSMSEGQRLMYLSTFAPRLEDEIRFIESQLTLNGLLPKRDGWNTGRIRSTGIWSWNPNLWFKSQDEANDYYLKQAQADAAIETANPTILGTAAGALRTTTTTTATIVNWAIGLTAFGLLAWGASEVLASQEERGRVRNYIKGGARFAGYRGD